MLSVVVRKMFKNKWMLACTLLGAVITVAILSSIPTYTDGVMQRMLVKDLEASQQDSGKYPGGYLIEYDGALANDNSGNTYKTLDEKIWGILSGSIDLPILSGTSYINAGSGNIVLKDTGGKVNVKVSSLSGLNEHVRIIHGSMYSGQKTDGVYEAIASEEAMKVLGLTLGNTYEISDLVKSGSTSSPEINPNGSSKIDGKGSVRVKVTGIYAYRTNDDLFWFKGIESYKDTLFMDADLLRDGLIADEKFRINKAEWYFAYDYHKLRPDGISSFLKTLDSHSRWFEKYKMYLDYEVPAGLILQHYGDREKRLVMSLLVLQIPILLVLAFYSFMISKLKIEYESNEIAVMKSRGASSAFIFSVYLTESLVIGAVAIAIGPLLGFYICRVIGLSDGFMEFVQRTALPLSLATKAYLYSFAAIVFFSASMLTPAFTASRMSIVLYKQKITRGQKTSFWKKYLVDFIMIAISFYGLYTYQRQQTVQLKTGISGAELGMDPLLYMASVLFIFGSGLLVLRVFPYIVRIIFRLGSRVWSPALYAAFIGIGRSSGKEQLTMVFIILTLSIGIFSACSARTINTNMEEKVWYETGADIVVKGEWTVRNSGYNGTFQSLTGGGSNQAGTVYNEPPFEPYTLLMGVESATKVMKTDSAEVVTDRFRLSDVTLMGIIPDEFGKTAWFRNNLLPHHWYEYLNLLTDSPTAVLASKAFKKTMNAKEGDLININWGGKKGISCVIYAFIDYWPSLNPNRQAEGTPHPYFVVAYLDYMNAMRPVEPYEVWLKKKPGVTSTEIYNEMADNKISLSSRKDAAEIIIKRKNDPAIQGTNGFLTLGFIVNIIISAIGFFIYWVMSIKKRVLQFGIFRAMGLTKGNIIRMLVYEQLLITGTSFLAGVAIGGLAGRIFIPLLQLVYSAGEQVLPFRVVAYAGDYLKLYTAVAVVLLLCITALWRIISRINVSQALKLGED